MDTTKRYPTDLTNREWAQVARVIPAPKKGGRPAKYDRREITNALLYITRAGCPWRMMPKDLPPWRIVYWYFMQCTRPAIHVILGENRRPDYGAYRCRLQYDNSVSGHTSPGDRQFPVPREGGLPCALPPPLPMTASARS